MILLQIGFAGMYVVAVASLKKGMSHFILVVYRNIFATLFMAPFALYFERYIYINISLYFVYLSIYKKVVHRREIKTSCIEFSYIC
jgi:hypothetical protein